MRTHQARILRVCTALLGDPVLAEDATQEVFIKAYHGLRAFRGGSSLATWLYRIAANHCRDLLRARARQRTESWEALLEHEGDRLQQLWTASPDPRAAIATADLLERVLAHLTPDQRVILTLRELEGLSYEELAHALDCSVEAVRARLRRARQDLQEKVRHFWHPTIV